MDKKAYQSELMTDKIVYPFVKEDGFVRACRKGCTNCTHCTEVLWDYTDGIYATTCELNNEAPICDAYENDGTNPMSWVQFNNIKKSENVEGVNMLELFEEVWSLLEKLDIWTYEEDKDNE